MKCNSDSMRLQPGLRVSSHQSDGNALTNRIGRARATLCYSRSPFRQDPDTLTNFFPLEQCTFRSEQGKAAERTRKLPKINHALLGSPRAGSVLLNTATSPCCAATLRPLDTIIQQPQQKNGEIAVLVCAAAKWRGVAGRGWRCPPCASRSALAMWNATS